MSETTTKPTLSKHDRLLLRALDVLEALDAGHGLGTALTSLRTEIQQQLSVTRRLSASELRQVAYSFMELR